MTANTQLATTPVDRPVPPVFARGLVFVPCAVCAAPVDFVDACQGGERLALCSPCSRDHPVLAC